MHELIWWIRRARWNVSAGWLLMLLAAVIFVWIWLPVVLGQRVMLGGDLLGVCCLPWSASPGPHSVQNILVGDPMTQFLEWQGLVQRAFLGGQLPLWDPYALGGKPLLANDQSAPFSPFTWLAIPFPAARGLTLAMLAKFWVAGLGMALYLRLLRVGGIASAAGAVAYASSSFLVIWLGWPQASVAALLPWVFAAVEWYVRSKRWLAWGSVAVAVALQFLAGHAESSLHLGLGVSVYSVVRWLTAGRSWTTLIGLLCAAAVGTALAGAQLVPFASELRQSSTVGDRAALLAGLGHLRLTDLTSWLIPNARGNPAIDHGPGRYPNYYESTGFAGVAMLVMGPLGLGWAWRRDRSATAAILVTGLVAAGMVYGPLTPIVGRLPGFASALSSRATLLLCFVIPAFGALGVDALHRGGWRPRLPLPIGAALLAIGTIGLTGVVVAYLLSGRLHGGVARVWPTLPNGYQTFWVVVAAVTLVSALGFLGLGLGAGKRRAAALGVTLLAFAEGALFAGPLEPQVDPSQVPPQNALTTWLQANASGDLIATIGNVLPPETASLYGLHDAGAYDVVSSPRVRVFWSRADPGYQESAFVTVFTRPDASWLATAGVSYLLSPRGHDLPGTVVIRTLSGVDVARVPHAQPFAVLTAGWERASSAASAGGTLAADPTRVTVLEGAPPADAEAGSVAGAVRVLDRSPGHIRVEVSARSRAALLVHESYADGWIATLDGKPDRIYPANVLYQSVIVPPGRHVITFTYAPISVKEGVLASGAGLLVLALVLLLGPRIAEALGRSHLR